MSAPSDMPVRIPTPEELRDAVIPRRAVAPALPGWSGTVPKDLMSPEDAAREARNLSREAERFLRHAAEPHPRALALEERWKALGISSGSVKNRILAELRRHGYIRLERKGRSHHVHLFGKAYEYLGLPRPSREGVGGTTHQLVVKRVAALLKKRGWEVHIEQEIGPHRKRVDVVAYGKDQILGVEVGLTDLRQEIRNLREDLRADVLDRILFVTTDQSILTKVREMAAADTAIEPHLARIRFYLFDEEGTE